jgi:hypothetical protein
MPRRRAIAVSAVARSTPPPPKPDLGWCPVCGEPGETRSQRQGGIDSCTLGHQYPSCDAVRVPPEQQPEGQH